METLQPGVIRVMAGDEERSSVAGTEQIFPFPPQPPPIRGVGGRASSVTSENTQMSEMLWPGGEPTHGDVVPGVAEYIEQKTAVAHTRHVVAKASMAERYKATLNPFERAWRTIQAIAARRHPSLVPHDMTEGLIKWSVNIETCQGWANMTPNVWQNDHGS